MLETILTSDVSVDGSETGEYLGICLTFSLGDIHGDNGDSVGEARESVGSDEGLGGA